MCFSSLWNDKYVRIQKKEEKWFWKNCNIQFLAWIQFILCQCSILGFANFLHFFFVYDVQMNAGENQLDIGIHLHIRHICKSYLRDAFEDVFLSLLCICIFYRNIRKGMLFRIEFKNKKHFTAVWPIIEIKMNTYVSPWNVLWYDSWVYIVQQISLSKLNKKISSLFHDSYALYLNKTVKDFCEKLDIHEKYELTQFKFSIVNSPNTY